MNAEQIIKFIKDWIERELRYEKTALENGREDIASDCHRRVFTLELLLSNIK